MSVGEGSSAIDGISIYVSVSVCEGVCITYNVNIKVRTGFYEW